ncbi:MAG TPA: ribonuclease HII [Acidimicrobiales bacterium]|nr:ribonuclease HII [Acidimicrobiales bacterium]
MSPVAGRGGASKAPTFVAERALFAEGARRVAGLDEVGRGAWAGPVCVGVVVITPGELRGAPRGVRDSKLLVEAARERLFEPLGAWCPAWAVGEATSEECDALGMTRAQALAATRALAKIGEEPDAIIVDGLWDYTGHPGARPAVGADRTSVVVAAASVLAKVTRDRMMIGHSGDYPEYRFERNKGYATPEHRRAVAERGMTPLHRRRWTFAEEVPAGG